MLDIVLLPFLDPKPKWTRIVDLCLVVLAVLAILAFLGLIGLVVWLSWNPIPIFA